MKIKSALASLSVRVLYESFNAEMLVRIGKLLIPGYDIHARSGIPENIPITAQTAASQLLKDVLVEGRYLQLIELLLRINREGFMGREYPVCYLRELLKGIAAEGYLYDSTSGLFMERGEGQITPHWGRLIEGEELQFVLFRLDIVQNSLIVRDNPKERVDQAYGELREIVHKAVYKRMGRIWAWEGDGAIGAFLFGNKHTAAVCAAMEVLHELFFYNRLSNPLDRPLQLRLAVHGGPLKYSFYSDELKRNEVIREIGEIEASCAKPDTLVVSENVFMDVDRIIQDLFGPLASWKGYKTRSYSVRVGESR